MLSKCARVELRFNHSSATAWLAYIGFTQSMLGPLMLFLRGELSLNYTLGGLLPAALAVGPVLSGLLSDRIAHR